MSDTVQVTRRNLLLGSMAGAGALILSRLPDLSALAASGRREKLYLNTDCRDILSLGDVALDDVQPWTWRMVLAAEYESWHGSELSEKGLQYAREICQEYCDLSRSDGEFDELAFQQMLDEEHPDSIQGTLDAQYDDHVFSSGSVARAYHLLERIFDNQTGLGGTPNEPQIGVWFEKCPSGLYSGLDNADDAGLLAVALEKLGVPLEVVVV